jgi:hypothetical protein
MAEPKTVIEKRARAGKCRCDICKNHAQIRGVIRRGDKKEMRRCIEALWEVLCNTDEELSMANAYINDLKSGKQKL